MLKDKSQTSRWGGKLKRLREERKPMTRLDAIGERRYGNVGEVEDSESQ